MPTFGRIPRTYDPTQDSFTWIGPGPVLAPPTPILRAYEATIEDVSKTDRSIVAKINTGDVDRYRTVIEPNGIDLTAYRKNPCVLWEHGKDPQRGSLPIGRNQWIKSGGSGNGMLIAKTLFGKDEYSQSLFDMYEDGTLRGWSVNILPDNKRCSPPTKEEMRARPELSECTMMYRFGELAEYSGVAVPGNAETLSILAERGIWCPRATESQGMAQGGAAVQPVTPDPDSLPRKKRRKKKSSIQAQDIALTKTDDKSDSSRSIVQSDGMYRVLIGSHSILVTSSKDVAEATLNAIDMPIRPWSDEYIRLLNYQRSWQTEMESNAKALLDMIQTGRV